MKRLDKRRVIRFVARHGLPCEHLGPESPTYNGWAINLDVMDRASFWLARWPRHHRKPRDLAASRILHEVGHALIVSPKRRRMPNYGLGQDSIGGYCEPMKGRVDGRHEEATATALTVALAAVLADTEYALEYLHNTGFDRDDQGRERLWRGIVELQRRGLLDGHRPTPKALGRS